MVGVCTKCEEEIEHLWEGGWKVGPNPERVPFLGHHGICPRYKQALWKMIEERRATQDNQNATDAKSDNIHPGCGMLPIGTIVKPFGTVSAQGGDIGGDFYWFEGHGTRRFAAPMVETQDYLNRSISAEVPAPTPAEPASSHSPRGRSSAPESECVPGS